MKPVMPRLAHYAGVILFPWLLFRRPGGKTFILLITGLMALAGCFQKFYSTGSLQQIDAGEIGRLQQSNKYFILHYQDSILHLYDLQIDNQTLSGKREALAPAHARYLNPAMGQSHPFKQKYREAVLSEVHLYASENAAMSDYPLVNMPLSSIYRADIYNFDQKRTNTSTILSVVGIAAAGALITIIATSSSKSESTNKNDSLNCGCPQVYVESKGNFDYVNGLFSGAVYANLERTDVLPLGNLQPDNGLLNLRIGGHKNEIQYLNQVSLLGVPFSPGTRVLADRKGQLFQISRPQAALSATDAGQTNLLPALQKPDGVFYAFDSYDPSLRFSQAYLRFPIPSGHSSARLILRARNSHWAALLDQEFNLLFGENYIRYRDRTENGRPDKMENYLLQQGLPISVYIRSGDQWKFVDYFALSGTDQFRDLVLNIPLTDVKGEELELKLETAYRFWDLDYAALDFEGQEAAAAFSLTASAESPGLGHEDLQALLEKDRQYRILPGDENLDLRFRLPEQALTGSYWYLLSAEGYYHVQQTYPVHSNISALRKFKKAGAFDRFSREKYQEWMRIRAMGQQSVPAAE